MKGFTLIEVIIVVALLALVAMAGVNTITEFQRNAILAAAAQELASTLRTAQTNSIAGQIKTGETSDTFSSNGFPYFGVQLTSSSYQLIRNFTPSPPPSTPTTETLEDHTIDPSLTLTFSPVISPETITFSRITGLPSSAFTFTLTRSNGTNKVITVQSNGLIKL